jgi:hypothetical protein
VTTLTDKNCIHKEIKWRLNSRNARYHLVWHLLSSLLLPKTVEINIKYREVQPCLLLVVTLSRSRKISRLNTQTWDDGPRGFYLSVYCCVTLQSPLKCQPDQSAGCYNKVTEKSHSLWGITALEASLICLLAYSPLPPPPRLLQAS